MDKPKVKRIEIWQQENSTPRVRYNVECYTKGNLCGIFKVVEYYG